jgi:hypothetical protein
MEDPLSPFPGAEETGIFPILRAICSFSYIGEFNVIRETLCFKKILQDFCPFGVKTGVDVNRNQFVINGNTLPALLKEVEKREAIFSSGDPHYDPIPVLDQPITVDRLSH